MPFKNLYSGCFVRAVVTVEPYPFVHSPYMTLQGSFRGCFVRALVTVEPYPFVYDLLMIPKSFYVIEEFTVVAAKIAFVGASIVHCFLVMQQLTQLGELFGALVANK